MPRFRDHAAEYRRRLERGIGRGLTRSQARGHGHVGERAARSTRVPQPLDDRLTAALRMFRATGNASNAARTAHVSRERFGRFLREEKVATRNGRSWTITDNLIREVNMISEGRRMVVRVRGFDRASTIAHHKEAVRQFIATRDLSVLAPFVGWSVEDVAGHSHPLETRPNTLLRLASSGGDGFETVYRIIV